MVDYAWDNFDNMHTQIKTMYLLIYSHKQELIKIESKSISLPIHKDLAP